ncbi:WxL domain-containing protein [Enterococcus faecalis]|uniref:WxL domain-containing protein n=2 Tax=Enterococcus faecalis TaxID=1351 RepID=UPI002953EBC9|nr:WxL domain-containing protein [Enterococcus faecalis]MDV7777435.1 WxL domain-containing protein [Enterococcus faecalis]
MKKKIMASLLVGSAVVGASLTPLSAQATTTGNTPVQAEFGGGTIEGLETGFDLITIPNNFSFSTLKIGDDLSAVPWIQPTKRTLYIGDLRGTKEGWHVTGEIKEMKNEVDILSGEVNFGLLPSYAKYDAAQKGYVAVLNLNGMNIADDPTAPSFSGTSMKIGGGASSIITAPAGKGQGIWTGAFEDVSLNVTTPMQQLKKGAYTENITWNLVAGPSI